VKPEIHAPMNPQASNGATWLYAKFAWAAESFILATFPDATPKHFGRASKIVFKEVTATLANRNGHVYATPSLSFWEHLGSKLRMLRALLKNQVTGTARARAQQRKANRTGTAGAGAQPNVNVTLTDQVQQLIDQAVCSTGSMIDDVTKWWPPRVKSSPAAFQNKVHTAIQELKDSSIKEAIVSCNKALHAAIAQDNADTTHKYQDFLRKSLAGSAGTAHALLRAFEKDNGISYEVIDDTRAKTQGVSIQERMTTRFCQWGVDKWDVLNCNRQSDLTVAWQKLQDACNHEECQKPKFSLRHLKNILLSWPAKAGLGIDLWVIRLWATLPDEALRVLLNIIYMSLDGAVPMQMLLILIGLMPKEKGGERPIALTAMLYRVAMKLMKRSISEWDQSAAGFWDTAIAGNSCLRAALCRSLGVELAVARGFSAIGILWDISAFFDSIRIHRLVDLALKLGFPPMVLRLSLKVHTAARAFKEGPYVSQFLKPSGVSILAGCGASVSFTRAALYDVLDGMHRSYRPCQIQTFVDDIPQVHTGPEEIVAAQAVTQALDLAARLKNEGFSISSKSTVVASSESLGKRIVQELGEHGLHIALAQSGRDLGCDFTAGARRRVTLQAARKQKVKQGTSIVLKMTNTLKDARKLQLTAIRPRAWGFAALGCSPSMAKSLRSQAGRGLNIKKAGGCLTTAFYMHGYQHKDPWLLHSLENVLHFMQALMDLPSHLRLAAESTWHAIREELGHKFKWARVKGPMSSAIATLIDWDFEPLSLTQWIDPTGATWVIDYEVPSCIGLAKEVLEHHFLCKIWRTSFSLVKAQARENTMQEEETGRPRGAAQEKHTSGSAKLGLEDESLSGRPGGAAQNNCEAEPGRPRGHAQDLVRPSLQVYKAMAKAFKKDKDFRKLYFLEAVVQGAMDVHTERHLTFDRQRHLVICSQCGEAVAGESAWTHFATECTFRCTEPSLLQSEACQKFQLQNERARHEAGSDQ
jgi:hypothetical protein